MKRRRRKVKEGNELTADKGGRERNLKSGSDL